MAAKSEKPQLKDQAATAALYVTNPAKKVRPDQHPLLDENGKLSSAGAATSLKYAKATDLPSFPSTGGVKLSSAGAAASLANNNQKGFEHWKPGALPAAEKAALLAKDYKADPLWHPELSKAGSKAALLAHRDGGHVNIWLPEESEYGQSAAGQAAAMKSTSPVVDKSVPSDAHRKALLAATGAMAGSRRRAESAPSKPDVDNKPWALKAATASQRQGVPSNSRYEITDPVLDASRIHNIAKNNVSREMYTSHPPVSIEVEERNREATLRASAVAMAQKMYAIQQKAIDQAKTDEGLSRTDSHRAAVRSHNRRLSTASSDSEQTAPTSYPQYSNLQEAAMKLAQERLDKLETEHKTNKHYRDYYGAGSAPRSRLTMRGSLRRRASSDGQLDRVDEEQSQKIRSQMSIFKSRLDEVDSQKRQTDRNALMAAAQKNVQARMSTMDEKVFNETGKASPAMMQEWERKAREKAEADSANRMENYGKVGIGHGKYMDQAEVEAIARARLQPTLNDISEKAEAQRARDEEIRLDQEERKRKFDTDKAREAETKAALKSAKEQEKMDERVRKEEERLRKEKEKRLAREEAEAKKAEEKRLAQEAKEEKRKSRDNKSRSIGAVLGLGGAGAATTAKDDKVADEAPTLPDPVPETDPITVPEPRGSISSSDYEESAAIPPVNEATTKDTPETKDLTAPASPTKKSWFSKFRRSSKPAAKPTEETGATATATTEGTSAVSDASEETPGQSSLQDMAMVGRAATRESDDMYEASSSVRPAAAATKTARRSSSISSMSSSDDDAGGHAADAESTPERGRSRQQTLKDRILNKLSKHDSHDDDNDEFEEARDTFDELDKSEPASKGLRDSVYASVTGEPAHDSKFKEEL